MLSSDGDALMPGTAARNTSDVNTQRHQGARKGACKRRAGAGVHVRRLLLAPSAGRARPRACPKAQALRAAHAHSCCWRGCLRSPQAAGAAAAR